ncbi:MAG: hypothetical protein J6S85_03095 [Methanobrevibacter sp.]|nr:hypothetical protein [Methanobrevibacter sp.]
MDGEMTLFEIGESYSLVGLKDLCLRETKQKFPKPVDGEDWEEYNLMIQDESDLLFAERLRKIADDIERRVLEPQSKMIKETYEGVFK